MVSWKIKQVSIFGSRDKIKQDIEGQCTLGRLILHNFMQMNHMAKKVKWISLKVKYTPPLYVLRMKESLLMEKLKALKR